MEPTMTAKARAFFPTLILVALWSFFRCAFGLIFSYGKPEATLLFFVLFVIVAVALGVFCRTLSTGKKILETPATQRPLGSDGVVLIPWGVLSLLFFYDALTLGASSAPLWPLLIVCPLLADPDLNGAVSLFSAALPAAFGILDSVGAFPGSVPRYGELSALFVALGAGVIVRFQGRQRQRVQMELKKLQEERERSLVNVRDAEVEIAARIQRALLIDPPGDTSKGLRLEAITVASNAVDGDFYGFVPFSPYQIDILIGDVMGKGVPAALVGAALKSAFLRSTLRLIVTNPQTLPVVGDLIAAVHESVVRELMDLDSFATLQYARIDSREFRMDFVDCGHTAFLHYDAPQGVCWSIKGSNLPMGLSEEATYVAHSVPLSMGDRLLFYSDGVSEAPNETGELFGQERLASIIRSNATLEPKELIRRIINTAMYFASSGGFRDDVTCVAVSIDPEGGSPRRSYRDFSYEEGSLRGLLTFLDQVFASQPPSLRLRISKAVDVVARIIVNRAINSDTKDCDESTSQGLCEDERSVVEELLEEAEEEDRIGELHISAYRVECVTAEHWSAVRILYHGPGLFSKRGHMARLFNVEIPDSWYLGESEGDLHLVGLIFDHPQIS